MIKFEKDRHNSSTVKESDKVRKKTDNTMASRIKTLIETAFVHSNDDKPASIFDDGMSKTIITFRELRLCCEKLSTFLNIDKNVVDQNLPNDDNIIGIAFDVDSKNVLNYLPSIYSAILNQVSIQ